LRIAKSVRSIFEHELEPMKISELSTGFFSRRRYSGAAVVAIVVGLTAGTATVSQAARVSGILTGYENSTPQQSRDLHFQNAITRDTYLSPTHKDGSFAATLPPGVYDLRTETGVILKRSIVVEDADVGVGTVSEVAPYAPARLFEAQVLAPSILTSPAPSTAFIMTVDTTVVSAGAQLVPKRKYNWSKTTETTGEIPTTPVAPVAPIAPNSGSGIPKLEVAPAAPGSATSQPPSP
jgi:hypothetical protein